MMNRLTHGRKELSETSQSGTERVDALQPSKIGGSYRHRVITQGCCASWHAFQTMKNKRRGETEGRDDLLLANSEERKRVVSIIHAAKFAYRQCGPAVSSGQKRNGWRGRNTHLTVPHRRRTRKSKECA